MRIRDKIKKPQRPVVAYEILPPREKDGTLNVYAETISSLLSQTHIDAINIPEVHDEVGRGERPVSNQERGEPRKFGMLLQDIVGIEAIINRVVVHMPLRKQMEWIKETYSKYEIDNLIYSKSEEVRQVLDKFKVIIESLPPRDAQPKYSKLTNSKYDIYPEQLNRQAEKRRDVSNHSPPIN